MRKITGTRHYEGRLTCTACGEMIKLHEGHSHKTGGWSFRSTTILVS